MTTRTDEQNAAIRELIRTLETLGSVNEGGQHDQYRWLEHRGVTWSASWEQRLKEAEEGKSWEFGKDNICGTTGCAAGWATVNAGYQFRYVAKVAGDELHGDKRAYLDMEFKRPGETEWDRGYPDFVEEATDILGFTPEQAGDVFYTLNETEAINKLYNILDGTWEPPTDEDEEDGVEW
jgi:hypothetical protein